MAARFPAVAASRPAPAVTGARPVAGSCPGPVCGVCPGIHRLRCLSHH